MKRLVLLATLALGGCSTAQVEKYQAASANFRTIVAGINADIAAVAPLVASNCADLQKYAMLIAPFVPNSGKAQQYFGAANGALTGFCQSVPSDIPSTVSAVASAVSAARNGYYNVSSGAK